MFFIYHVYNRYIPVIYDRWSSDCYIPGIYPGFAISGDSRWRVTDTPGRSHRDTAPDQPARRCRSRNGTASPGTGGPGPAAGKTVT